MKNMKKINLKVGQQLDAYHDGKSSPSRLVRIVVDDILDRSDFSRDERRMWKKAISQDFEDVFDSCVTYISSHNASTKQFWDWNCTMFIVGHILNDKRTEKDKILFALRADGFSWYAVNWNYALDLTGRIRKTYLKTWRACADENGRTMKWNKADGRFDYFDKKTGKKVDL